MDHGNSKATKGNSNARKDEPADATIHLRVTSRKKSAVVKQAQREGTSVTRWVMDIIDKHIDVDLE